MTAETRRNRTDSRRPLRTAQSASAH